MDRKRNLHESDFDEPSVKKEIKEELIEEDFEGEGFSEADEGRVTRFLNKFH